MLKFVIFLLLSTLSLASAFRLQPGCRSYVVSMQESLMEVVVRHFQEIDSNVTEIEYAANLKQGSNPSRLIKHRFGHRFTSADFMKFVLTLSYVDSPPPTIDADLLRESIYEHINNGNIDEAREGFGRLLLLQNNLYLNEEHTSVDERCMNWETKAAVMESLLVELNSLKDETTSETYEEFIGLPVINSSTPINENYFNILGEESLHIRISKRSLESSSSSSLTKNSVILLSREYSDSVDDLQVDFMVDNTLTSVLIETTKSCGGMVVKMPNSTERPLSWSEDKLSLKLEVGKRYGVWNIHSKGATKKNCQVKVVANSTMGFFLTAMAPSIHSSAYKVSHGNPIINQPIRYLIDLYGFEDLKDENNFIAKFVRLVDNVGNDIVDRIPVSSLTSLNNNNTLSFDWTPDSLRNHSTFRILLEGSNDAGMIFQRITPKALSVSNMQIEYDNNLIDLSPGKRIRIPISVTNYGPEEIIGMSVWDKLQYSTLRPKSRKIAKNETKSFNLVINVPIEAVPGSWSKTVIVGRSKRSSIPSQTASGVAVVRQKPPLKINSMIINTVINSRFAETTIQTTVTNNGSKPEEASIDVHLPIDAFVTNFTMFVDNELVVGKVEEKKKADKIYNKAKQVGVTAGKVAARQKSDRDFRQSLLAAENETIVFTVTYQQLLHRFNFSYDYSVVLNPNQPINRLVVDILIVEEHPLLFVRTPGYGDRDVKYHAESLSDEPPAGSDISFSADRRACRIRYSPSITEQTAASPLGLNGAYTVLYDVAESDMHGTMSIHNGHFIHFYAARNILVFPKAVIYVMDVSGSMSGTKEQQAVETLIKLIESHDEHDYFNIIFFSTGSRVWKNDEMVQATDENKEAAIEFVKKHGYASGYTNIYDAYKSAFDIMDQYLEIPDDKLSQYTAEDIIILKRKEEKLSDYWKMICFLTDGVHTADHRSDSDIASEVRLRNRGRVNIHNVAYGDGADYSFMQQVSAENGGTSRRIFENMDAATSIKDFFYEVTNVLMTDIKLEYETDKVESITESKFDILSKGKEIVVSGRFTESVRNRDKNNDEDFGMKISGKLTGKGNKDVMIINFEIDPFKTSRTSSAAVKIDDFAERIWAFINIKSLLQKSKESDDADVKADLDAKALELSLKYNFVTPLTSIVVLKDKDREKILKQLANKTLQSTASPPTSTLASIVSTTVSSYSTDASTYSPTNPSVKNPSGGNYGGIYRDPHVVLPLASGVNLCFNWNGKDREVHNLIFHPKTGLIVNGMMLAAPAGIKSTTGKPRVYIHSIAFVVPLAKANFIITPENITLAYHGLQKSTISLTSKFSLIRHGVSLYVFEIHNSIIKMQLIIDGIHYELMLHRKSRVPHIDFAFEDLNNKFSEGMLDGVVGQYYGKGIHLTKSKEGDKGMLRIGNKLAEVKKYLMKANPITQEQEPCWFSAQGGLNLSKGENSRFVVSTLETKPEYAHKQFDQVQKNNSEVAHHSVLSALFKK